jgi:SAM-dependent methyltransferase
MGLDTERARLVRLLWGPEPNIRERLEKVRSGDRPWTSGAPPTRHGALSQRGSGILFGAIRGAPSALTAEGGREHNTALDRVRRPERVVRSAILDLQGGGGVTPGYAYDHEWAAERLRLAGLEAALDPGTHAHLTRLGVGPGSRCLEVGAGGGSVALWLADQVAPGGAVVATDIETDFLEAEAVGHPGLEVLRHDIMADALPTGFDVVHARWLVEWLPDKRLALGRMAASLRTGGVVLIEEPDFVTIYGAAEPAALRRVVIAAMAHLEETCPVEVEYGRRALDDLSAVGLVNIEAEGRCPIVRGGTPLAADFLRLTLEKLREPVLSGGKVTEAEFTEAVTALGDSTRTVVAPMTVAAWGWRG